MAIENAITWKADVTAVAFDFNSNTKDLTAAPPDAWYTVCDNPDGLWGFDFTPDAEKVPQDIGVRYFTEFKEGHTVTLSGMIVAKELVSLRTAEVSMMQACWPISHGNLVFQLAGFEPMYVRGRIGQSPQFTLDKSQRYPIRETYVVSFRLEDPRFWLQSDDSLAFYWMT